MPTSERVARTAVAVALAALVAHCGAEGECLRYSDCADGLTCSSGRCIDPDATDQEAAADGPSDAADASVDAPADSTSDAGAPDGSASTCDGGACTADAGSSDAGVASDAADAHASSDAHAGGDADAGDAAQDAASD